VLSPLLRHRRLSFVLALAGTGQILATMLHAPAMTCPVMQLFKVPCPGCGASRACADLLHGRWREMARMHAFAPALVLAILLFWAAAVAGQAAREWLIGAVDRLERKTALPTLMLVGLILYWVGRLVYAPAEFMRLVAF
jgi:NhaP-type Na+/H+ or K+/H+ antiporter